MNKLLQGDCLNIMPLLKDGCVDLIYLDPPFFTQRDWGEFDDRWESLEEYVEYIRVRLVEMKRLLKKTGSLYLHCDPTASHYLKVMMDGVFGRRNYRNQVVWKRRHGVNNNATVRFPGAYDTVLVYSGGTKPVWNPQYGKHEEGYVKDRFTHKDERGRFSLRPLTASPNTHGDGHEYEFHGRTERWLRTPEAMERLEREGRIWFPKRKGCLPCKKTYLHESKGVPVSDLVTNRPPVGGNEQTGYPTQKPESLLRLFIKASSNENDLVLDPFCGTGTTCVAAAKLKRRWIGMDVNPNALEIAQKRLNPRNFGWFAEE